MRCLLLANSTYSETQCADIDAEIAAFVNQMEQFITTIPGIGPVTGATILAEIGDIERFASPAKLVALLVSTLPSIKVVNSTPGTLA